MREYCIKGTEKKMKIKVEYKEKKISFVFTKITHMQTEIHPHTHTQVYIRTLACKSFGITI